MEAKLASLIIAAVISSEVAVFFLQNFIFGKRIRKLEQKFGQDDETFRYKFHEQRKLEAALVDTMEEVRRTLKPIDDWLNVDGEVRDHLYSNLLGQNFIIATQEKAGPMTKDFNNNYILDDDVRAEAIIAVGSFHDAICIGGLLVYNAISQIALDDARLEKWKRDFCKSYIEATQKLDAIRKLVRKKMGVAAA